jgi:hypothetical protein
MLSIMNPSINETVGQVSTLDALVGAVAPRATVSTDSEPTLFTRIVALYQGNTFLLAQLKSLRLKLAAARSYLRSPGCNRVMGEAHLSYLRSKHSAALTVLRANRITARKLLLLVDADPESHPKTETERG